MLPPYVPQYFFCKYALPYHRFNISFMQVAPQLQCQQQRVATDPFQLVLAAQPPGSTAVLMLRSAFIPLWSIVLWIPQLPLSDADFSKLYRQTQRTKSQQLTSKLLKKLCFLKETHLMISGLSLMPVYK